MGRFDDRTLLVTGAASGIGLASARRLLDEGAHVIGVDLSVADLDHDRFTAVVEVGVDGAVADAVDTAVAITGRLDGVMHAAGVAGGGPIHLLEPAEWERVLRANALCPGFIDTPLMSAVTDLLGLEPFRAAMIEEHALRRCGRPEEMAAVAAFLLSDDASFVTGHTMVADGGYSAGRDHGLTELLGL